MDTSELVTIVILVSIIYIILGLAIVLDYKIWFKKTGEKVEHPNRTITRNILNIITIPTMIILFPICWIIILLFSGIEKYNNQLKEYNEQMKG